MYEDLYKNILSYETYGKINLDKLYGIASSELNQLLIIQKIIF